MSITWGVQYLKLKTNLRLAMNRLKLLGKKKTELCTKARSEIADYIMANKPDRARIRVEHIIREDYLVEAYEILEMYCDLILARFGLIERMKTLDDGIAEAVISILWAVPRISADVPEFKIISDQLTMKYGRPFAQLARGNQLTSPAKVAPRLIAKLDISAPPKPLVERYLIEIANAAGLQYTPDPNAMREDEINQAEQMLIKFYEDGSNGNTANSTINDAYGWNLPQDINRPPGGPPPPGPGPFHNGGGGGNVYGSLLTAPKDFTAETNSHSTILTPQPVQQAPQVIHLPQIGPYGLPINPMVPGPVTIPNHFGNQQGYAAPPAGLTSTLQTVTTKTENSSGTLPSNSKQNSEDLDLNLPEVPTGGLGGNKKPGNGGGGNGSGRNDFDFDELSRRFDQLKRNK